jgi:predicted enzyme related to lactoylglutathione lyase
MQHPLHSFCFAELRTPDLAAAKRHYGDLLGWSSVDVPGTSGDYCLFQIANRPVVGLNVAQDTAPTIAESEVFVEQFLNRTASPHWPAQR